MKLQQNAAVSLVPSAESIQRACDALAEVFRAEDAAKVQYFDRVFAITDPVITPFARALRAEGFEIKKERGGCNVLDACPVCRSRYLFTAIKDGVEHQFCPHCGEKEDRKRAAAEKEGCADAST